jgi:hypothetical protein
MKRSGPLVLSILLLVVAAIALGCGSHSTTPVQSNPGLIQSITVNPSTADAKDFDGKVQFIATGYYKTPPSPVTPLTVASWGVCQEDAPTAEVAVSSSGVGPVHGRRKRHVLSFCFGYHGVQRNWCMRRRMPGHRDGATHVSVS